MILKKKATPHNKVVWAIICLKAKNARNSGHYTNTKDKPKVQPQYGWHLSTKPPHGGNNECGFVQTECYKVDMWLRPEALSQG